MKNNYFSHLSVEDFSKLEEMIKNKIERKTDIEWLEICDLFNIKCSFDHFRKMATGIYTYKKFKEENNLSLPESNHLQKIDLKTEEMEKEKYRLLDQRREFRKPKREQARFEHLLDCLLEETEKLNELKPLNFKGYSRNNRSVSIREGLALFSDWHYGMKVDTQFNKYNKDVFKKRLRKLVNHIIEKGHKQEIGHLHVAQLGDIVSGLIHVSARVQNEEDVIQQIMQVSEVLAEVLIELCESFVKVSFYNVIGNHSRVIAKKDEVGMKENFEYLIPWFLKHRLHHVNNLEIISDEEGVIPVDISGQRIAFVHGNYDNVNQVSEKLSQMYGYVFDYIFMGHIHHHYEKEIGLHTEVIVNQSLMGSDDYSTSKRLVSKPAQKFLILNREDGIECTYNIKFKNE